MTLFLRSERKTHRLLRKIIIWTAIAVGSVSVGLVGIAYTHQDQVIDRLVQSLNQYINTPVQVKNINVSAWRSFPQLAVTFEEVSIAGSIDSVRSTEFPLADVARIDFSFNLFSLLRGIYEVQQITLSEGTVNVLLDKDRHPNYLIFQTKDKVKETQGGNRLSFQLQEVHLDNVQVRYLDLSRSQNISAHAQQLTASLDVQYQTYTIDVKGDLESQFIEIGNDRYFVDQPLIVNTHLTYYNDRNQLAIESALVELHETQLNIQGLVDHSEETTLDLEVEASQSNFETLLGVLPPSLSQPWKHYRSAGDVHLTGHIKGVADQPAIQLIFGCKKASFFHPEYQQKLENIKLTGSFTNGAERNARTSKLKLNDISATLAGKLLKGNLLLRDFRNLYLETAFRGEFSVQSLLAFYPMSQISEATGKINADVQLRGKISDLKSSRLAQRRRTHSSGHIIIDDVSFSLRDRQLPFQQIAGKFEIQNNHLTIERMTGYVGHSHIALQGQFRNAIAYALTQTHPIQIKASLQSNFIDLDELLSGKLSTSLNANNLAQSTAQDWRTVTEKQPYRLEISPRLTLDFSCSINRLKFRRFRGRAIQSILNVHQQVAHIRNLSVQTAGGQAHVSALVNAQREIVRTEGHTKLEGIHADSLFYIFEDFQQDFLTARHLKGEVYATSDWRMNLDRTLQVRYPSLSAETYATLRKGELNNFEPMQRIARFVDEEQLDRLRFGDIQNYIEIRDQQIYIPRMLVHSNLSDIRISGTHTFNNHIDYRFDVPMRSIHLRSAKARKRAARRKQHFGEVAPDDAAPTKLFLRAQGTVDDYKISYDLPAAKTQLKENLAKEKKELKQVLRDKRKTSTYELELSDEYFEFESTPENQQQLNYKKY